MWELLVLAPFHFVLGALVMVIVRRRRAVLESISKLLLNLSNILTSWLSPAVVVLEVLVVKRLIEVSLQESRGNV
jgi:hypothetical protein